MFRVNINLIITSMINHTALAEVENRTDDSNQTVRHSYAGTGGQVRLPSPGGYGGRKRAITPETE
jgi:hypothetical protein